MSKFRNFIVIEVS